MTHPTIARWLTWGFSCWYASIRKFNFLGSNVFRKLSVAALTIYDMCKAVQKDMVIDQICLLKKSGGKSGTFIREEK